MRVLRITLGAVWTVAATICVSAWLLVAVITASMFYWGYSNTPDNYVDQADDRGTAWVFLAFLAILTFIVAALFVLFLRLRRRHQARRATPLN